MRRVSQPSKLNNRHKGKHRVPEAQLAAALVITNSQSNLPHRLHELRLDDWVTVQGIYSARRF